MVVATKIDPALQFPNFQGASGVLGFGLKVASEISSPSWFENLVIDNVASSFDAKVFGITLAGASGPKLVIGGRDPTLFNGSLTYTNLPKDAVRVLRGVPSIASIQH